MDHPMGVSATVEESGGVSAALAARTRRWLAALALGYGGAAAIGTAALFAGWRGALPASGLPAFADEAWRGGAAALVIGGLLTAFCGLLACWAMMQGRRIAPVSVILDPAGPRWRRALRLRAVHFHRGGDMARRGQGTLVPLLAALAATAAYAWRPAGYAPARGHEALLLGGFALLAAFPALIAERAAAARAADGPRAAVLPEVAALRRLLLLAVLACVLVGLVELGRGVGLLWAGWAAAAGAFVLLLVDAELALRALARWFLPPPSADRARAAVDSAFAAILAGSLARGGVAAPIRSHFGLDFSRSWALTYLRAAALPAVVLTALFCWALSGVTILPTDARGIYERLGAPVAVLGPGLHVGLPWPLGRVRTVEFGVVHEVPIGGGAAADRIQQVIGAEDPPTPLDDRLWNQAHPSEADYLIASTDGAATGARESFQTVSADIRVLWRVGLDENAARRAAYAVDDPTALVRSAADRLVSRTFAVRTLDGLMGERREAMAEELRRALVRDLAPADAGIEIVAVVIEAIHPPPGAADAYHAVQAAQIQAQTSISAERGRARGTESLARQEVLHLTDTARGNAADITQGALAGATRFAADRAAHAAAGRAFLVERYFADLAAGLSKAPLTIIDDRLGATDAPVIDLRPTASLALPRAGPEDPD